MDESRTAPGRVAYGFGRVYSLDVQPGRVAYSFARVYSLDVAARSSQESATCRSLDCCAG
jgi:hypothetical protein